MGPDGVTRNLLNNLARSRAVHQRPEAAPGIGQQRGSHLAIFTSMEGTVNADDLRTATIC